MSPEELRKQFGDEVYQVVDGSQDSQSIWLQLPNENSADALAMVSDIRSLRQVCQLHNAPYSTCCLRRQFRRNDRIYARWRAWDR